LPSRPTRTRRRLRVPVHRPRAVVPLLRGESVQLGLDHGGGEELPDRPAGVRGLVEAVLLALGVGLGVALFHSRFGFTSAWRQLVASAGAGLRAHAVLLGTTATLFALVIAPSSGPLGIALVLGAFLFGVGMQLGGACASGTLFAVGSGQGTIDHDAPGSDACLSGAEKEGWLPARHWDGVCRDSVDIGVSHD
jgi:hypothetical protein